MKNGREVRTWKDDVSTTLVVSALAIGWMGIVSNDHRLPHRETTDYLDGVPWYTIYHDYYGAVAILVGMLLAMGTSLLCWWYFSKEVDLQRLLATSILPALFPLWTDVWVFWAVDSVWNPEQATLMVEDYQAFMHADWISWTPLVLIGIALILHHLVYWRKTKLHRWMYGTPQSQLTE